MAYTKRRRETAQQRIEKERSRLEYLRGRLAVVEEVEDNPEGYELTITGLDHPIVTDKAEMLSAIRSRIACTEDAIAGLENDVRRAAGLPIEKPRAWGVIGIANAAEIEMRARAEYRKKLIAGA